MQLGFLLTYINIKQCLGMVGEGQHADAAKITELAATKADRYVMGVSMTVSHAIIIYLFSKNHFIRFKTLRHSLTRFPASLILSMRFTTACVT